MVPKVGLLALSTAGVALSLIVVATGPPISARVQPSQFDLPDSPSPVVLVAESRNAPADGRSTFNPDLTERVVIEDGFGNSRDDMTLRDVLDSTERLAELSEAEPGTSELYGLLPTGEWGVVGVCVERPMTQRSLDTQRVLTEFFGGRLPATFNDCGPAPGVIWPDSGPG